MNDSDARMLFQRIERIAKAMESIAGSLVKIANPPMIAPARTVTGNEEVYILCTGPEHVPPVWMKVRRPAGFAKWRNGVREATPAEVSTLVAVETYIAIGQQIPASLQARVDQMLGIKTWIGNV